MEPDQGYKKSAKRVKPNKGLDWVLPEVVELETTPKRMVNQSFLDSLIGLPTHDAEEMVKENGFVPVVFDHEAVIAQGFYPDAIHIWKDKDDYSVFSVSCGDTSQLVSDV